MRECNLPNSDELEQRAVRCRTVAAGLRHQGTREKLIRIADEYDLMAQQFSREERRDRRSRLELITFGSGARSRL